MASFRKRFGNEFSAAFVQVLQLARENQLSRFGTVSLDGTKIHANASRHSALFYAHAEKIEAKLKAEVQTLLALAEAADQTSVPDGVKLPKEIRRREDRLAAIAAAKAKIEARAKERFEREQAEYEAKVAARTAKTATGRKPRGPSPQPPESGPRANDQINLTDEESRIMKVSGGGFDQCYNAQAVVDTESMLILATHVTQATNDKEQIAPMVEKVQANPQGLNHPAPLADDAVPVETMKRTLKTRAGRAAYALRKQTVEPVFGIIKSVMGFSQFLLRGLENAQNEWMLVCLAWNLKRMAALRPQ